MLAEIRIPQEGTLEHARCVLRFAGQGILPSRDHSAVAEQTLLAHQTQMGEGSAPQALRQLRFMRHVGVLPAPALCAEAQAEVDACIDRRDVDPLVEQLRLLRPGRGG